MEDCLKSGSNNAQNSKALLYPICKNDPLRDNSLDTFARPATQGIKQYKEK